MLRFAKAAIAILAAMTCIAPRPLEGKNGTSNLSNFNQKLEMQVESFETGGRTAVASVLGVVYRYELPIGIEYIDKSAMTQPLALRFHNESVRTILLAIIQQVPDYQINFSNGLVNIFSPRERGDGSNLLNTTIGEFNVDEMDAGSANYELACALGSKINPSTVCVGSIAKGQLGNQKITLHLRNVKVYEIINAIVAQNGKAAWTVI